MTEKLEPATSIQKLLDLMEQLRGPGGCPWDKDQTPVSLRPYILEEAHELVEAIDSGDSSAIREELGDLLLQVVFQSQVASENQSFNFDDVAEGICEKLILRHPHVFGKESANTGQEAAQHWERIKMEKEGKTGFGRSLYTPVLHRALRLQEKAVGMGFDWERPEDLLEKIDEETNEIREALETDNRENLVEEIGDLFFMVVNLARFLKVHPEEALEISIEKFRNRFTSMEEDAAGADRSLKEMSLDEMEDLWNKAKAIEKR